MYGDVLMALGRDVVAASAALWTIGRSQNQAAGSTERIMVRESRRYKDTDTAAGDVLSCRIAGGQRGTGASSAPTTFLPFAPRLHFHLHINNIIIIANTTARHASFPPRRTYWIVAGGAEKELLAEDISEHTSSAAMIPVKESSSHMERIAEQFAQPRHGRPIAPAITQHVMLRSVDGARDVLGGALIHSGVRRQDADAIAAQICKTCNACTVDNIQVGA